MPRCPQCNKNLVELEPQCPSCRADLGLLVDYVSHLQGGLQRADNLTRDGKLADAVWAYLDVLEVDPDNATAKRQVGQVAAAVRRFDQTSPGRRWLSGMRRWFFDPEEKKILLAARIIMVGVLMFVAFTMGYGLGSFVPDGDSTKPESPQPKIEKPRNKSLTGK